MDLFVTILHSLYVIGGCCWERKIFEKYLRKWSSCEKYLSKVILLEGAGLFHGHFSCTLWEVKGSQWRVVVSLAQQHPGPFIKRLLTLGLCGSVQRNGVKTPAVRIWPTLESQEMGWTQLSTWGRKWICRAEAVEVKTSTTSGRFPLCISWDVGSVFSWPTSVQVIVKFKPLRMKVCNPCVIFKNCLKIRS